MPVVTRQMKKNQDVFIAEAKEMPLIQVSGMQFYEEITEPMFNPENCSETMKRIVSIYKHFASMPVVVTPESREVARTLWFRGFELILEVECKNYLTDEVKERFMFDIMSTYQSFKPYISSRRITADYIKWRDLLSDNYYVGGVRSVSQQSNFIYFMCNCNYFRFTPSQVKDALIAISSTGIHTDDFVLKMKRLLTQHVSRKECC